MRAVAAVTSGASTWAEPAVTAHRRRRKPRRLPRKGSDPFPTPPNFHSGVPSHVPGQPRQPGSGGSDGNDGTIGTDKSRQSGDSGTGKNRGADSKIAGQRQRSRNRRKNDENGGSDKTKPNSDGDGKSPSGQASRGASDKTVHQPAMQQAPASMTAAGAKTQPKSPAAATKQAILPQEDDVSQSDDRRIDQGTTLATTQVSLSASNNAYRGSNCPFAESFVRRAATRRDCKCCSSLPSVADRAFWAAQ